MSKRGSRKFVIYCKNELKINVIGQCIPPCNEKQKYFSEISVLNSSLNLEHLSLGMSNDYNLAIKYKSTFVRIGSAILGERKSINY